MLRCAPAEMQGIDPSEGQLAFARTRPGTAGAVFQQGDAIALPFEADRFDAAVMALVITFVPDPGKGVDEMTSGGSSRRPGSNLYVGHARRRNSPRANTRGIARHGRHTNGWAQWPRLQHGGATPPVDERRTPVNRDPRGRGATHFRQFRRFLEREYGHRRPTGNARPDEGRYNIGIKRTCSRASPRRRPGADHGGRDRQRDQGPRAVAPPIMRWKMTRCGYGERSDHRFLQLQTEAGAEGEARRRISARAHRLGQRAEKASLRRDTARRAG